MNFASRDAAPGVVDRELAPRSGAARRRRCLREREREGELSGAQLLNYYSVTGILLRQ